MEIPYNLEAEEAVLHSCFLSEDALYTALEKLSGIDFYHENHKIIFDAVRKLSDKNIGIDRTSVSNRLTSKEIETLTPILNRNDVKPSNIDAYCDILKENTKKRAALEASFAIQRELMSDTSADRIIETAQDLLFRAFNEADKESFKTPSDLMESMYAQINSKMTSKEDVVLGLDTSIKELNKVIYGIEDNDLILLAGRPSMGKTELALQMSVHNALKGIHVAWFSIEMSKEELMERVITYITEISLTKIKKGWLNRHDVDVLEANKTVIENLPLYIDDSPNLSISQLNAKARRLKQRVPELRMIVVDYLQLMDIPFSGNRDLELSHVSRTLKILGKSLNLPIVALSQLSRKCEEREDKRPIPSDLRSSGSLEQDADKILFMYSDYPYLKKHEKNEVNKFQGEIIVAKHRNGPVGTVEVTNNKPVQKFFDTETLKPEQVGYSQAITEDDLPF